MDKLNYKKDLPAQTGFSTIEILVAMVLIILALAAALMVSSGNQSILIDGETNSEALNLAQRVLENEQALARKDFKLVNSEPEVDYQTLGSITYKKEVSVTTLPDFFTKKIIAKISWPGMFGRSPSVSLTSLVTNFENAVGGDTCDSNLYTEDDWSDPEIESIIDFSSISPTGTYTLTDVDAYKGKLYVTAGRTDNANDPTFFIFDISSPGSPSLIDAEDNASAVIYGLNAVRVSEDASSTSNPKKVYAYVASKSGSDYSTCNPIDPGDGSIDHACGQLVIFDVTNANPTKTANLKIISSPAITGQNTGTSIFYKDGYIFLGLSSNSTGPEFHIVDVHNPSSLNIGTYVPLGSFEVGNGVNAISIKDMYAYLASPNSEELKVLDTSISDTPTPVGGFSVGSGNGKSMQIVGDKIYFGRTTDNGAGEDFQILNNTNPNSTLPELGGKNILSSVNSIVVKNYLSFLLTGTSGTASQLQIFRTDNPSNITLWNTLPFTLSSTGNSEEPSMDCEGNRLYISSNDSSGQGSIYIIKPGN